MFSADLKSDTLKGLISTLIDEVKFTITSEGMTLKAVDAAHVAMIEMEVEKCAFEKYEAEDCEIGLDLDKVKDVLKLAASGDVIGMEQDDTHGRLVFKVGNITRRMNLVDTTTMSVPKVPQLSLSDKITLSVDELQTGIRAADKISDHITLKAGPGYFDMFCEGDTDSVSLHLDGEAVQVDAVLGSVLGDGNVLVAHMPRPGRPDHPFHLDLVLHGLVVPLEPQPLLLEPATHNALVVFLSDGVFEPYV